MWEIGQRQMGMEFGLEKRMVWMGETSNWNVLRRHS